MNAKRTHEVIGTKTIHICTSTDNTMLVTVAVTIIADGIILLSMLIFEGQTNGFIVRNEFANFPPTHHYRCQPNASMDKAVMVAWVDEVLAPYVEQAPDDIAPLLVLDSYQCHMMVSAMHRIQELGVKVKHILGRCTSLCQPINVSFNKLFKDWMHKLWMS
jgi:hypothetical protein